MTVRGCLTLILLTVLTVRAGAERWSRQVSNSEWIPLANPRAASAQVSQTGQHVSPPPLPPLALPPAIQQQYQQQLLQLQKTQENIQKLLLLQQQLRAQQQILQTQTFIPSGFGNSQGDEKQLHSSGISNLPPIPDLGAEVLVPPLPSSEALPPIFPPQNFLLHQTQPHLHQKQHQSVEGQEEFPSSTIDPSGHGFRSPSFEELEAGQNPEEELANVHDAQKEYVAKHEAQGISGKRPKVHGLGAGVGSHNPASVQNPDDDNEEVQLVYVPAETLAQRGQPKRGRGRKYHYRQQQQHQQQQSQPNQNQNQNRENPVVESTTTIDQEAFARSLLEQLQRERDEKTQFLKEERMKEIVRLNEEQRALERKVRLQQEAIQREQEIQRQRDAEKKKKELEKLEEMAKQKELQRIREAREKQRQEEIERRRLAELRAKEERRKEEERQRETDRLATIERQKQDELQRAFEEQRNIEQVATTPSAVQEPHSVVLPLIREPANQQLHRQHLTETSKPTKRFRGRQRQRVHQFQEQAEYREPSTTTPSPNQPPLSVYMGASDNNRINVKISDVLKILKEAKTIAVLDTVGPDAPQVFVGPTSLDPPNGYAKFDLPYLSSIDHNRVERKVDKLPFFVAPLSFDPPPGYSKIPFPAPHIGSVVVNTIDSSDNDKDADNRNPSPTPLIEPNSYIEGPRGDQNGPSPTTPTYESHSSPVYTPDSSSSPRYEPQFSTSTSPAGSGGRFRFRQFYGDSKPASVISTSYQGDQLPNRVKQKQYYDDEAKSSTPSPVQSSQFDTSVTYRDEIIYSSTPSFQEASIGPSEDPTTKEQDLAAQLALINQELTQHRNVVHKYNGADQYHIHHRNPNLPTGPGATFDETNSGDINDVRSHIGPTHYNLPSELPAISPLLPGLVNSLIDKHEPAVSNIPSSSVATTVSSVATTTTTTTTPRPTTTTYRPRGRHRGRIVSTRPPTTQAPSNRAALDRARRPFSRSRSRYTTTMTTTTTTTEEYRDPSYEVTKAKTPETTQRYNGLDHHSRRPTTRSQKYRNRDKSSHSGISDQIHRTHAHQATYENSEQSGAAISAPSAPSESYVQDSPSTNLGHESNVEIHQPSSSLTAFTQDFQSTSSSPPESFPLRAVTHSAHHGTTLAEEYARGENYPRPEELRYHFDQSPSGFDEVNIEKTPVNGFNYQVHPESEGQVASQGQKDFPYYAGKLEDAEYTAAVTTEDPTLRTTDEQGYSTLFGIGLPQRTNIDGGQPQFEEVEGGKIGQTDLHNDQNTEPIFVPLPENKQELYGLQSTETPETEPTTESITTTAAPVIIRQRVRGRGRIQQDPAIQTRPRGSQDEYVRLSAVNRQRDGPKTRTRVRPQSHSQIQTDGYDYVKIHAAQQVQQQQQRPIVTTTPAPLTTTTQVQEIEEDVDYGFIRPPNFRPAHPVDNRFGQQPVTFRPSLSQIQSHLSLNNDDAAVESSPTQTQTHVYKNRLKYQQTPIRRPSSEKATTISITTPTPTTTTKGPTPPASNTVYTVRPKTRPTLPEEQKTRIRGRIRRPGRKRTTTTTTTESGLDANNELPPDENYPRIYQSVQHSPAIGGQPVYDENFGGPSTQFVPSGDRTAQQLYDVSGANYPSQDFVLNFGSLHDQETSPREEYDQTQLASDPPRRYQHHSGRSKSTSPHSTPIDIYGAESQWSTKLTKTSFQPSFASNRVPAVSKDARDIEESQNVPEIITAGPEISSVTLVVSSDDKYNERELNRDDEESMIMGTTTVFGKKTARQNPTDKLNATVETSTQSTRGRNLRPQKYGEEWNTEQNEPSDADTTEITKVAKKTSDAVGVRKNGRRKRVRVRVRPVMDDFVTAESQHFNSAVNSLAYDQYKYNPIREYRLTTTESPSVGSMADEPTRRSVFQDFLEEMLKTDEAAVPILATSTSTELPEDVWVTSLPTLVPEVDSGTTLKGITETTLTSETEGAEITEQHNDTAQTLARSNYGKHESIGTYYQERAESLKASENLHDEEGDSTSSEHPTKSSQTVQTTTDDLHMFSLNHRTKINDLESDSLLGNEHGTKELNVPIDAMKTYTNTDSVKTAEYPKNHREKWSEVRYPSAFDRSRIAGWNYDGASAPISGINGNKKDANMKTLSDYVKAIFDTMKNAEEDADSTKRSKETTSLDSTTLVMRKEETSSSPISDTTFIPELTTQADVDAAQTTLESLKSDEAVAATITMTTTAATAGVTDPAQEATTIVPSGFTEPNQPSDSSVTTTSSTIKSSQPTENVIAESSTESMLGKILRTSTTTKVSHMTEICYRGRCVMTKPKRDDVGREERIGLAAMGKKKLSR